MFTIDDLLVKCKTCKGTGEIVESGGGGGSSWSRREPCRECGGEGGSLTEAGEAVAEVIKFLQKNGRLR